MVLNKCICDDKESCLEKVIKKYSKYQQEKAFKKLQVYYKDSRIPKMSISDFYSMLISDMRSKSLSSGGNWAFMDFQRFLENQGG